jgi:hypothetical protein
MSLLTVALEFNAVGSSKYGDNLGEALADKLDLCVGHVDLRVGGLRLRVRNV